MIPSAQNPAPRRSVLGSLMLLTALTLTPAARADQIAYEGFDYPDGTLAGQNGGTGTWNGAWTSAGGTISGGEYFSGTTAQNSSRPITVAASTDPIYLSATFTKTSDTALYAFWLQLGASDAVTGNNTVRIGLADGKFSVRIRQGGTEINGDTAPGTYTVGTTVTVVGKLEYNVDSTTNERLTIWVDPTAEETAAISSTVQGNVGWTTPTHAHIRNALLGANAASMDDIRIGSTWASVVPEPEGGTATRITSFSDAGGGLWELTLEGEPDTGYEFRSSPTLEFDPGALVEELTAGDPALGAIAGPNDSILVTDGDGLGSVRMPLAGPKNFVRAGVAPPLTLFVEDFESAASPGLPDGWTNGRNNPPDDGSLSTTVWETGTPANVGPVPPGVPLPSGSQCVATDIAGNYFEPAPAGDGTTSVTDIWLRTPPIALGTATAATLRFMQWTEIEAVSGDLDYGSIRILDASDDSELAVIEDRSIDGSTNGWKEYSKELPAEAFTAAAGSIKIEFRFEADDLASFAGWYIDDLMLTAPAFQ